MNPQAENQDDNTVAPNQIEQYESALIANPLKDSQIDDN